MGTWAQACVATAVRIVIRVGYVLQVQTDLLDNMTKGRLSGDVRARILLGRTLHASPLPTVRFSPAKSFCS